MRRIYTQKGKQRPAVAAALRQMRETRAAIGPAAMTRLEMLVKDFDADSLPPAEIPPGGEPVDQRKNLLIIMKYLEIMQKNKSVQTQVRTLLSEAKPLQ